MYLRNICQQNQVLCIFLGQYRHLQCSLNNFGENNHQVTYIYRLLFYFYLYMHKVLPGWGLYSSRQYKKPNGGSYAYLSHSLTFAYTLILTLTHYILHIAHCTLHIAPYTLHLIHYTLNPPVYLCG